jgi:predicted ATPase
MLNIEFHNYKRLINRPTKIINPNKVNYLVGVNGSGKTSVLSGLAQLGDVNDEHNFQDGSFLSVRWKPKDDEIHRTISVEGNPLTVNKRGGLSLRAVLLKDGKLFTNADPRMQFDYNVNSAEQLDLLSETAVDLQFHRYQASLLTTEMKPFATGKAETAFFERDRRVQLNSLSGGLKSIHNLKAALLQSFQEIKPLSTFSQHIIIYLVEEPENSLHPSFQKKIPGILDEFIQKVDKEFANDVYCFVSTHSPFLISEAANYDDHKVFLMEDGGLLDLDGTQISESAGYHGSQCAHVVGRMLGADASDLGYPENFVLVEEYSLQIVLQDAVQKKIIRPYQFISTSGIDRAPGFIEEMERLNTLLKCNPFYGDRYLVVLDNFTESDGEKRLRKMKDRLGKRFVELHEDGLEDYYNNVDAVLHKEAIEALSKILKNDRVGLGIMKAKYARLIAQKINSKLDFSKLFNSELDLLLA